VAEGVIDGTVEEAVEVIAEGVTERLLLSTLLCLITFRPEMRQYIPNLAGSTLTNLLGSIFASISPAFLFLSNDLAEFLE